MIEGRGASEICTFALKEVMASASSVVKRPEYFLSRESSGSAAFRPLFFPFSSSITQPAATVWCFVVRRSSGQRRSSSCTPPSRSFHVAPSCYRTGPTSPRISDLTDLRPPTLGTDLRPPAVCPAVRVKFSLPKQVSLPFIAPRPSSFKPVTTSPEQGFKVERLKTTWMGGQTWLRRWLEGRGR